MRPASIESRAKYWRRRAKKARALAEHMDYLSKELMLTVAMDYERIAKSIEARKGPPNSKWRKRW